MRTLANLAATRGAGGRTWGGRGARDRCGSYAGLVEATCWSDYLCPWCYVGQHRDALFAASGVTVVHRPYELHPEIPPAGRPVRPDGRLRATFDRIEQECATAGLAFRRPERMPNTGRALATAEWVRLHHAPAFPNLHRALFAAQFATGDPLDDADLLDELVTAAGAPCADVRAAVDDGRAGETVAASMAEARGRGITSTPTWVLGELTIPGALDPETLSRWIGKVVARHDRADTPDT